MEIALGVLVVAILALALAIARTRQPPRGAAGPLATIEFLDVGQGDSILIRSPEGKVALIDAGPSRSVVRLLEARGVRSIDLVVVTHHHADHYGGMLEVIRRFHPKVFLDSDSPRNPAAYVRILDRVRDDGMTAIRPDPSGPRKLTLGTVTLTVLPQPPPDRKEENNNSVGIRVDYGGFSALLTGDSQGPERRWWLARAPGLCSGVDVLKLAHHGSRNGVDRRWLEATAPRLAVASLGAGNDYGHPHKQALALLEGLGIRLDRTDLDGTVRIRSDGRTWTAEGSKGRAAAVR